jgi:hypothetical protein
VLLQNIEVVGRRRLLQSWGRHVRLVRSRYIVESQDREDTQDEDRIMLKEADIFRRNMRILDY